MSTAHWRFKRLVSGILDTEIDRATLSKIKGYIDYEALIEIGEPTVDDAVVRVDTINNDNTQQPAAEAQIQNSTGICIPSPPKRQSVPFLSVSETPAPHRHQNPITPTPRKPLYDENNPPSKYSTLNYLDIDLMLTGNSSDAIRSRINRDNIVRDVLQFKKDHGKKETTFDTANSKHKFTITCIS
jgi:hypothetical protein